MADLLTKFRTARLRIQAERERESERVLEASHKLHRGPDGRVR